MTPVIRPYRAADRAACHRIFYRAVHQGAASAYTADQRAAWAPSDQPDPTQPDMEIHDICDIEFNPLVEELLIRAQKKQDAYESSTKTRMKYSKDDVKKLLIKKGPSNALDRITRTGILDL